ncbi:hypothetical protein GCM10028821_18080 [Hymenobacter jeollabukensis]
MLASAAHAAVGQKAAKPAKTKIDAKLIERVEKTLADDKLRGRALNTGAPEAAQFLAGEFRRIGLQPMNGLTSFLQEFPAYEVKTTGATASLNGAPVAADHLLVTSGQEQVSWTSGQAGAPAAKVSAADPVTWTAGSGDAAPKVLVLGAQADFRKEVLPLLRAPKGNVLVVLDPAHAQWFQRLAGQFSHSAFRAEKPAPYTTALILASGPVADGSSYQLTASSRIREMKIANVVGVLPGRDKAKAAEQVVFSAHYDHIGILPPVAGDSIANGADDDASGTAAVVALAQHFKKTKQNARTLIFVAFTAEEIGGFGSQYFSKQLDAAKVTAMFNIEMIGKVSKFGPGSAFITGFDKSDFGPILQRNLQGSTFKFEPDPYPEQQLFYRSDNATLARLGVPAHSISTDQIPTDKLYHSVDDEVETLDLKNMTTVIEAIAVSARGIVAGTDTPTRITDAGQRK